jgi:amino-acid N-acetyltransferase
MDKRETAERGPVLIRRATLSDVEAMHALINHFADEGLMLPKARSTLYQNIRDFYVADADSGQGEGTLVGCGALHVIWVDLGEIRSLAVAEPFQKDGVGRRIAEALLREADSLRLPRVFALTYQKSFFEHLGFVEVDKTNMPHKVWGECMDCPKFPNCDEVAVVKNAPFLEEEKWRFGIGERARRQPLP